MTHSSVDSSVLKLDKKVTEHIFIAGSVTSPVCLKTNSKINHSLQYVEKPSISRVKNLQNKLVIVL